MPVFLWTQRQDIGPGPRAGHSAAYDGVKDRTVLFGGSVEGSYVGETWEWAGEYWTQVEDIGPPARAGCAMSFDAARERVVLFGGRSTSALYDDTWTWDGQG